MPLVNSPKCKIGWKAEDFKLLSVDDKIYNLNQLIGKNGTLIAFICNHCPYVISIAPRLSFESKELKKLGINTIAIMPNDADSYPEDSFENMKKFSKKYDFEFPYLYDVTQETARIYQAVCTPEFYGFNRHLKLCYRGRIDSGVLNKNNEKVERELFYAMEQIAKKNIGPEMQFNSFGCSIKWK